MSDALPRRVQQEKLTAAERLIHDAVGEVNAMGADLRLTDAETLLTRARNLVADFVDGVTPQRDSVIGPRIATAIHELVDSALNSAACGVPDAGLDELAMQVRWMLINCDRINPWPESPHFSDTWMSNVRFSKLRRLKHVLGLCHHAGCWRRGKVTNESWSRGWCRMCHAHSLETALKHDGNISNG